jgi:hypothetical protein
MTVYSFPLHDTQDYKGRIIFTAVKENYRTLVNTAIQAARGEGDPRNEPQNGIFRGTEYSTVQTGKPDRTILDTVSLYLPSQLRFGDAAEYTNVDLGMIGAATALGISEGASGKELLNKALSASLPSLEDLQDAFVKGLGSEAAQVAALRSAGAVSSGIAGAIETETGITLNPNRRSTFKGIGLRRFQFSFQMIPTSALEARRIKEVIGFFRHNMYPDMSGTIDANRGTSAAFKFPSKFYVGMYYGSKKVGTGILPCFCEYVNVTYNPNSMAFHDDGEPQETVIELGLIEERALTKADIMSDNANQGLAYS